MASISLSQVIERRPEVVFAFVAVNHVRNHPRWDPQRKLEQLTKAEMGVGARFKRTHTRIGVPIEGEMEVVEFEPGRSMGFVIRVGRRAASSMSGLGWSSNQRERERLGSPSRSISRQHTSPWTRG